MKTNEAKEMGTKHAIEGGELTPFGCREVDAKMFAAVRGSDRPAKEYAKLRGAFNSGWMAQQFAQS